MDNILSALQAIPVADLDYTEWIKIGMALKEEGYSVDVWDGWSQDDIRYNPGECETKWNSFHISSNPVTGGTIIQMAKEHGWVPSIDSNSILGWDDTIEYDGQSVSDMSPLGEWNPVQEFKTYISLLFSPEDIIGYVTGDTYQDPKTGKWKPKAGVYHKTCAELLDSLDKYPDDLGATIGDWNPEAGAWIRFNLLDGQGVKKENVTGYKYALVESDSLPIEEQSALLRKLKVPIRILVNSGGKSSHGITEVDATNAKEYGERVEFLYTFLEKNDFPVDRQNSNPNRCSRLPGVTRNGNKQNIIATNIGCKSWTEWMDYIEGIEDELPEMESLADYKDNPPTSPKELIAGILRQGHKMLIAGPSKAGKSFLLMELCLAIAEGLEWLGFQCRKGRVLYVNLEIDRASCINRLLKIYKALDLPMQNVDNIVIWNLRGFALPLDQLVPILISRVRYQHLDAIIIDPIYKVITGDENSASDMGAFCNQFDKICDETGASTIYCHHHSKGAQGSKKSMDRASGSGVFARDPDALLDIIELELSDDIKNNIADDNATAWHMESSLREFANIKPVNFWYECPIHRLDTEDILADLPPKGSSSAGKMKNTHSKSALESENEFRTAYNACNLNGKVTVKDMTKYLGVSDKTIYARIKKMENEFMLENGHIIHLIQNGQET